MHCPEDPPPAILWEQGDWCGSTNTNLYGNSVQEITEGTDTHSVVAELHCFDGIDLGAMQLQWKYGRLVSNMAVHYVPLDGKHTQPLLALFDV
jgi:hypothetical protein